MSRVGCRGQALTAAAPPWVPLRVNILLMYLLVRLGTTNVLVVTFSNAYGSKSVGSKSGSRGNEFPWKLQTSSLAVSET